MPARYDAIVIGAGPAGEAAVSRLDEQGLAVALVERELVGGECAYWACIPSKTLLRATEVQAQAQRTAGVERPQLRWGELAEYRDYMTRNLDDSEQVRSYEDQGIDLYKGQARLADQQTVEVGDHTLQAERLIVATGSEPEIPMIDGLADSGYWTNREATTLSELPSSVAILGGGPVGIELAQLFIRLGVEVTLCDPQDRLIAREDPAVSELAAQMLGEEGVQMRLGAEASAVAGENGRKTVTLASGESLSASELILATGRKARIDCLGLEQLGIKAGAGGIEIDERCRAANAVWAIGDVTGVMPFTHVGKYQARIVARDIAGEDAKASYGAIPRVVFSDPEIAAVGLTASQARERDIEVATAEVDLAQTIARPATYEREPRGKLGLVADRERGVLLGAWAVAPLAGEWIHHAALAIKAEVPLSLLRDTVAQFPTYSEGYLEAVEALAPAGKPLSAAPG